MPQSHIFVAIRDWEPGTMAFGEFLFASDLQDGLAALRRGVKAWLADTSDGRQAWEESNENFTWKNLAAYWGYTSLRNVLVKHQVYTFKLSVVSDDYRYAVEFDEVLRPRTTKTSHSSKRSKS